MLLIELLVDQEVPEQAEDLTDESNNCFEVADPPL